MYGQRRLLNCDTIYGVNRKNFMPRNIYYINVRPRK